MKDPAWYLQGLGLTFTCAVTGGVQARLDEKLSARVNHEVYYFSMSGAKRKFLANPLKWCGDVTDPVSGMRFRPGKKSPRRDWEGRPYFFASEPTAAVFDGDPARYAEPAGRMIGTAAPEPAATPEPAAAP